MLDIGGDIGALVATMPHWTAGSELYLRPDRDPATSVHTGVWERSAGGATVTVAVFPELVEGAYRVLDEHGEVVRTVEVVGGEVVTIDLRTAVRLDVHDDWKDQQ